MSRRNKEQRVNYHLFPLPPFKGEIKAALSCLLPPFNPPLPPPAPQPTTTLLFTPVALHQPPIRPRLLICSHRSSLIGDLHIHHLYAVLTDSRVMPPRTATRALRREAAIPASHVVCYKYCVLCFALFALALRRPRVSPLLSCVLCGQRLVPLAVWVCPFHQSVPPINHDQTHVKILFPTLLHTLRAINHSSDPSAPVGLLVLFRGPHRLSPIHHYFVCF